MEGSTIADDEVIRRVLAGSKEDFATLVARYQNLVYGMIMRQVGDPAAAKDLAQETFLRAYRSLQTFEGRSSFGTWLTRIALNRTSSYFASREFQQRKQTTSMETEDRISQIVADSPSNEVEAAHRRLRTKVAELPEKLRAVIVLCSFENKSYQQASEILEIPIGTVSSRMNRGMCLLREALKGGQS